MIVAAVLAILLTLTMPRFQGTAQRLRTEQAAFETAQWLRLAHERAISEGRDVLWSWDERSRQARVELADAQEPEALRSRPLPEGFSVNVSPESPSRSCTCVRFFPGGTSEATTLTVAFQGQTYDVTVDEATGRAVVAGIPAR